MTNVTIFGTGNMGSAIASVLSAGGASVEHIGTDAIGTITGDVVVLAVPYSALADITAKYAGQLAGKIVVETTNPLDFSTFDSLVVPTGSSATAELAAALPSSKVLKGFNTTFAATLATKKVGDRRSCEGDRCWPHRRRRSPGSRRRITLSRPRARGPRIPAAHARRCREDQLDRRFRTRQVTNSVYPKGPHSR
jgi:hypothetical protein